MLTDEELRQNIRDNLKAMRKLKGLTQAQVGDLVGKKETTIASWEQGLSLPDLQTLYRLSLYYRKTMEWFYEHNEKDGD